MSISYKNMSYDRALEKAMRYCSYQERCTLDLTLRFEAWGVNKSDHIKILGYLVEEDYLNETRYVSAYVRGKFTIKKWGRYKIKMGLMAKRVFDEKTFAEVFEAEISPQDYEATLVDLHFRKEALIEEPDAFKKRDKLYRYLLGKGYESELVTKLLNATE